MSRSFRKTNICGHSMAESDKEYKVKLHRKERRKAKQLLNAGDYDIAHPLFHYDDWITPKDGKGYISKQTVEFYKDKVYKLLGK